MALSCTADACQLNIITAVSVMVLLITSVSSSVDSDIINAAGLNAMESFYVTKDSKVMVKLEYDIMMSLDFLKSMLEPNDSKVEERAIRKTQKARWSDAYVPYKISQELMPYADIIRTSIEEYMKYTCLRFEETNNAEIHKITFTEWTSCGSTTGYSSIWKGATVFLGPLCFEQRTILHEVGHALGLYHEQSRPDRDRYIRKAENPQYDEPAFNFRNIKSSLALSFNIEYDYRSIMHYWRDLTTLDPAFQDIIGHPSYLSFRDIKLLNLAYNCAKRSRCVKYNRKCPFNGFVLSQPLDGQPACQCWCDAGAMYNIPALILCSSISQSLEPVYDLKMRSSLVPTDTHECTDVLNNCTVLKENRLCFVELRRMKKVCAKTCNFCGRNMELCMDYDEGCQIMAKSGICKDETLQELMSKKCPYSCGLCRSSNSECDIQRDIEGPYMTMNHALKNSQWITSFVVFFAILG